jgi:hypothetical protein
MLTCPDSSQEQFHLILRVNICTNNCYISVKIVRAENHRKQMNTSPSNNAQA